MDASSKLRRGLRSLRREWREAAQSVQPSKQFGAELLLGLIGLHLEAKEIFKTNELPKRKELLDEFHDHEETVQKAVRYLGSQATEQTDPDEGRAMSGLR